MIIRKCDRCGKEIKNNFWTIAINEEPDEKGCLTTEGAKQNLITNINKPEEYCTDCINEIKAFINRDK